MQRLDFKTMELWLKKLLKRAELADKNRQYNRAREFRSLANEVYREFKEQERMQYINN